MTDFRWLVTDNPMLWRFFRSRLRRRQMVTATVIVVMLGVSAVWAGREYNWIANGQSLNALIGLQAIMLIFVGSSQIGQLANKTRTSGMLDFHRIAPLPALNVVIGFLFGAPCREYVLATVALPFAIYCSYGSPIGLGGYLLFLIPFLFTVWIAHAMTLLNAMIGKAGGGAARSIVFAVFIFYGVFGGISGLVGIRTSLLPQKMPSIEFFGVPVPALIMVLLDQIAFLSFFVVGNVRKMISDRTHTYSKPQVMGYLILLGFIVLGSCWTLNGYDYLSLVVLYAMIIAGIILLVTCTPDMADYLKGLDYAQRQGRKRPAWWTDAGINRVTVGFVGMIVLTVATIAWSVIESKTVMRDTTAYSLTIAIGVFVVAYFGLGYQWFLLASRKGGQTMFMLFLVIVWGVPLVAGSIMSATYVDRKIMLPIMAISPWAGLSLSAGVNTNDPESFDACRMAALVPAMIFAFVFNNLVTNARRKIELKREQDLTAIEAKSAAKTSFDIDFSTP